MTDREWSLRASERAALAISVAGTVQDRLGQAMDRIEELERSQHHLMTVLDTVLTIIERRD